MGKMNKDQDQEHQAFLERYALLVGKLVINLQGLELLLRTFLQEQPGADPTGLPADQHIFSPTVGSILNLCPLTNWDTLGELIGKYNAIAEAKSRPTLDPTLVDIRDALAHGRIAALEFGTPTRLIKYSKPLKPHKKTVQVTFSALLNEDWFSKQVVRVSAAMQTVDGALSVSHALHAPPHLTPKTLPNFRGAIPGAKPDS